MRILIKFAGISNSSTGALLKELTALFRKNGRHRLLLSNISWQTLERAVRIAAGIFTGIWLVSYLGPALQGTYAYAFSFVMILSPLISLGYDGYLVRDIVFEKKSWGHILGSALLLRLLCSVLALVLLWGYTLWSTGMAQEVKLLIRVFSISFLLYPFDVFDIWFRARLRSKMASIAKIAAILLINGLKLYFIFLKAPLLNFAWLYVAEFGVNGLLQLSFYLYMEPGSLRRWTVTTERTRFMLLEAWPLFLSSLSLMIYNWIDQIMIGNILAPAQVGIYSAAAKISDMPVAIILVLNSSLYPFLAANYTDNMKLFRKQYRLITEMYTAIAYVMLGAVWLAAGWIISIYPPEFAAATTVLRINFIGVVFLFNSGLRNSYLSLAGRQIYLLYTTVFSALLNIGLNLVMIPAYGIAGAAWASVITEFSSLFLLNILFTDSRYIFEVQAKGLLLLRLFGRDR